MSYRHWVKKPSITALPLANFNLTEVNGAPQTADDWTLYFRNLDTKLSTLIANPLPVSFPTPVAVSGTVSATQGTSPWIVGQSTYANLKAAIDLEQILGAAISLTNYLPVGNVYPAGTLIDPRAIRALAFATDNVNVNITEYLNSAVSPSNPIDIQIDVSGAAIDPRNIRALTKADVVTVLQGSPPWTIELSDGTNILAPFPKQNDVPAAADRGVIVMMAGPSGAAKYRLLPSGINALLAVEVAGSQGVDLDQQGVTGQLTVLPKVKGQTTIVKSAIVNGVGSVNIYTVTALKTFYLVASSGFLLDTIAAQLANGQMEMDTGGDSVFRPALLIACVGISTAVNQISVGAPMAFPAGTVFRVTLLAGANASLKAAIIGWEE